MSQKNVTAALLRAARALLGWSQADLAKASMVSRPTIAEIELDKREPQGRTLADIVRALENAGVEFTGDDDDAAAWGVAWRKSWRPRKGRPSFGLHNFRLAVPISYTEAGLARLDLTFDQIKVALSGIRGIAAINDGDMAGPLDILRMRVDTILDESEAEDMLDNIALAIKSAFELGEMAGEHKALRDRRKGR